MGESKLRIDIINKDSSSMTTKVRFTAGSDLLYAVKVERQYFSGMQWVTGSSQFQVWDHMSEGASKVFEYTWSSLASNTKYRFKAKIWWRGSMTELYQESTTLGAVYDEDITYPIHAYNLEASQNGNIINVSWVQEQGGQDSNIENKIVLTYSGNQVEGASQPTIYNSGSQTHYSTTLNISGVSMPSTNAFYNIYIYSNNSSTKADGATISNIVSLRIITLLKWSWTSESGSWNAMASHSDKAISSEMLSSRNAISVSGFQTTYFYATVWNDIARWLKYNYQILGGTASIGSILMSSSDKVLTADRWNDMGKLWNLIASKMNKGQIITTNVAKGDPVNHGIFVTLIDTMNTYIDSA